jgi:chromosome partitioning protein
MGENHAARRPSLPSRLRGHLEALMMRTIAFANQKGGVGKTTCCVNLAICLAQRGKKVLLVDMDPQANATVHLGLDPSQLGNSTSSSLLDSTHLDLEQTVVQTDAYIDLVPANRRLLGCNKTLLPEYGRETRLRDKLDGYAENTAGRGYDYVMIDCAPALDLVTTNALMAAGDLIVPTQARFFSLKGLAELADLMGQLHRTLSPKLKVMGVIITMFDRTAALDGAILELLKEKVEREYGDYLFPGIIYRNVAVSESERRRPVVLHDPESSAAQAYRANAEEILRRSA